MGCGSAKQQELPTTRPQQAPKASVSTAYSCKTNGVARNLRKRPEIEVLDITDKPINYGPCIYLDYAKCIGCHNCARACSDVQGFKILVKGPVKVPPYVETHYGNHDKNNETHRITLTSTDCVGCGYCVVACPVGALEPINQVDDVRDILESKGLKVAVLAPATRVGVAEGMGMPVGSSCERQLIKYLRAMGFDKVFDNLMGADICTREDLSEVLKARKYGKTPVFTSCCPAWVRLAEEKYPELLSHMSTAKSPQGITCALIKQYYNKYWKLKAKDIKIVGFMPCTSKKNECLRDELMHDGVPDCDVNITSRELVQWLKELNVYFSMEYEDSLANDALAKPDEPFRQKSGSAYIYGKSSGVSESVMRYICAINKEQFNPQKMNVKTIFSDEATKQTIKMIEFPSNNELYKFAIAAGGTAVRAVADMVKNNEIQCDCVEVMCCPYGCISGGGQPKNMKKMEIPMRAYGLERADYSSYVKNSMENEAVNELYSKLSAEQVHYLFHTKFAAWE